MHSILRKLYKEYIAYSLDVTYDKTKWLLEAKRGIVRCLGQLCM